MKSVLRHAWQLCYASDPRPSLNIPLPCITNNCTVSIIRCRNFWVSGARSRMADIDGWTGRKRDLHKSGNEEVRRSIMRKEEWGVALRIRLFNLGISIYVFVVFVWQCLRLDKTNGRRIYRDHVPRRQTSIWVVVLGIRSAIRVERASSELPNLLPIQKHFPMNDKSSGLINTLCKTRPEHHSVYPPLYLAEHQASDRRHSLLLNGSFTLFSTCLSLGIFCKTSLIVSYLYGATRTNVGYCFRQIPSFEDLLVNIVTVVRSH